TGTVVSSAGVAPSGNVAAGLTSFATFNQMVATSAPVPLASTPAIRSNTSSAAYASPTRPEKSARTSYGVARRPYTSRSATFRARSLAGAKRTANVAAAANDPIVELTWVVRRPTIAASTAAMKTTSRPTTTALLITT